MEQVNSTVRYEAEVCGGAQHQVQDNAAAPNCDTICIPRGRPHRFLNRGDEPMAMIWVYAGDEPDREIVDQGFCDGILSLDRLS